MSRTIEDLAKSVQCHVPWQPWGSYGNEPVPLEIYYSARASHGVSSPPWAVGFVLGLNSTKSKRRWGRATGETLEEALTNARNQQLRERP